MLKTEDQVREELKNIVNCEVGQLTTFNQLGFTKKDISKLDKQIVKKYKLNKVLSMKPDGWFFDDAISFGMVCETKSENKDIDKNLDQLFSYMFVANTKYKDVVGIIFNGSDFGVYKMINGEPIKFQFKKLENKEVYINSFNESKINTSEIYQLTETINNILHFSFQLKNLNHRMIWTACVLVARRFGIEFSVSDSVNVINQKVVDILNHEIDDNRSKNNKLFNLVETFRSIRINDEFVKTSEKEKLLNAIDKISANINLNNWNGEDVMAIFFNEFTRYKGKSEQGQIFTPDHITSFMCKLANVQYNDHVLDACCGSGSFLTKAMCNMIQQAGGSATEEAKKIKQERIFGIEKDEEIYALACANMLLHKDGKTNLRQWDATSEMAGNWIKSCKITKVLMNPPYENGYKPLSIVKNVLDNVEYGATCLFLLPNRKLRTLESEARNILKNHTLEKIIKLPDIFKGMGSTGDVSIFWFKAHVPQDYKNIQAFWIKDDGLVTVKNKGRHDVNLLWEKEYMPYWIKAIQDSEDVKYSTKKILNPEEYLEYPDEVTLLEIFEEDFEKVILDRILFENPDLNAKLSPYSAKNNPDGISHKDWIINMLKILD